VKRAVTTPLSAAISSACPSANGLAQSSRISSACSCFLGGSASTSTALTTSTVHTTAATLVWFNWCPFSFWSLADAWF
jgi:hypothetical protein